MLDRDEFSTFGSAIEWPEMRPFAEEATGELKPIFPYVVSAIDLLAHATTIAPDCESPIEVELGAWLRRAIEALADEKLQLVPQYVLRPFRYDFAITRNGRPVAFVECDGKDFHSTQEQLANDRAKDKLAEKQGVPMFRFSGSEIVRDGKDCARDILCALRYRGQLTADQWERANAILARRPTADASL